MAPPHQPDLLARVLGVVAGVGLVGHQMGEADGKDREVGVDSHAALQVAEVVVEPSPRLIGDELELDMLAFGKSKQLASPGAQVLGE